MKRLLILIAITLPVLMTGQIQFIENTGQWENDFEYRVRLKYGALFFESDGVKAHLFSASDLNAAHGEDAHAHDHLEKKNVKSHAYKQKWIGAKTPIIKGKNEESFYHNYFIGNQPNKWRGKVPVYKSLFYDQVYNGISADFTELNGQLKYNWIVEPGADPTQISWTYDGADSVWIENKTVIIKTSVGYVNELLPKVYTKNGFQTISVDASFELKNKVLSFRLGNYNKKDTLIIDPIVVFSSFSGSLADNWGFTATYDDAGNLFGGGIVMAAGYPVTTGAFQTAHANPTSSAPLAHYGVDCAISKFNAQGNNLEYSTYLGGNSQDQPHSMYVDAAGDLFIFGVTGSNNFPVSANAYQNTFNGGDSISMNGYDFGNGTDIFVVKFNPTGSSLLAATYIGGTGNDGLNWNSAFNYADQSRGEIVIGPDNMIYITASTLSTDFPTANAAQNANSGKQDAVVFKLNNTLSNISWSTYYGGTQDDAGYGLKVGSNNTVYICGSTAGSVLTGTSGKHLTTYQGGDRDGYIASFDQTSGAITGATYVGTNAYDQTFLLDLDKFNNVYVLGQTLGNYPVSANVYFNYFGKQFIHKFGSALSTSVFSTVFGRGQSSIDIVPTALNVDDCLNILLSGWGGLTNQGYLGGRMINLPVTPDAFQSTTDESDFYFMVLGPNADSLKYATFFGGSFSQEHVDGGTSRFDKHGNIFQAVCAGCGGYSDFPTTPGAWSNTNNSSLPTSNCNLGVIKINFETSITANALIDTTLAIDTNCNTLTFTMANTSRNANRFVWDFGNGKTSRLKNPTVTYDTLGVYTIKLVAFDTICDISDSIEIVVNHDQGTRPTALFDADYNSCDVFKTVYLTNNSKKANKYLWSFGDGKTSDVFEPTHSYANQGVYLITLIATDTTCGAADTTSFTIDFTNNIPPPEVIITPDSCFFGGINVTYRNDSAWYQYVWNFNGKIEKAKHPSFRYRNAGNYTFSLTIVDTLCNAQYTFSFTEDIERIENRVFIPNAFTPNRDNINEEFIIAGNKCLTNATFKIFNSFGDKIFETNQPFGDFWNGYIDNKPAQEDVYVYVFKSEEFEKRGYITVYY